MNNDWINLFVYGTLRTGCQRSDILSTAVDQGLAEYKYMAQTTKDYDLLDFGSFPGLIYGSNYVGGEVYSISPEVVKLMDEYEDHPTIFVRQKVTLFGNNTEEKAQTYFFNIDEDRGLLLNVLSDSSSNRKTYVKNLTRNLKVWQEDL